MMHRSAWRSALCLGLLALWAVGCSGGGRRHTTPPPYPSLDPRCSDRAATGRFDCTIYEPAVTRRETAYPSVVFAPGDVLAITADGCVQRGGRGKTWARYVNPAGAGSDHLYHGLIRIPTATPAGGDLVRIQTVIGRPQTVTGAGAPLSELVLHLGYEDDHYEDNGYADHDDGAAEQCKLGGAGDGGPAHVTITICRGVPCATAESRFDFNVVSDVPYLRGLPYDANGLPYNPTWSWQRRPENQGQIPSTSLCHEFSERLTIMGVPLPYIVPSFSDCTDQADVNHVDIPVGLNGDLCWLRKGGLSASGSFVGHVNWFPVTLEGKAYKIDSEAFPLGDDDYTFTYRSQGGDPLSVNGRPGLHFEFDSKETIEHFQHEEWKRIGKAIDDGDKDLNAKLFAGHTIVTGMFGMDGEHGLKAELHPVFAIATRRDEFENDPRDDVWLMFVRNRGNEGFCSSRLWDAGFEDYTVRLPWLPGMTAVDVDWSKTGFEGTDGTSGPSVAVLPPPAADAGVYVTFHLGPAASSPFIDGALHLSWTGTPVVAQQPVLASPPEAPEQLEEADLLLRKAFDRLTPAERQQLAKSRAAAAPPRRATHRLPPGTLGKITAAPELRRTGPLRAIDAGPAIEKNARDQATLRALCAVARNAPDALPPTLCQAAAAP
jgi:hypothetical protein